jgi:hypothetical protein
VKVRIAAQAYHLRYVPADDRILLSVDLSPECELSVPITRRLTRSLVMGLAKLLSDRAQLRTPDDARLRETMLDFQHSQSVADALAKGTMREEARQKPLTVPAKPVRTVNILEKPNGAITLMFDTSEQVLTVDVAPQRIHVVLSTFLRMADRAGWDFPPIASWLEASKDVGGAAGRVVN